MEMETQLEREMLLLEKTNATLFQALTAGAGAQAMMPPVAQERHHHSMSNFYDSSKHRKLKILKKEVGKLEQQKVHLLGKVGEKRKKKAMCHQKEARHLRRERDILRQRIRGFDSAIVSRMGGSVKGGARATGKLRAEHNTDNEAVTDNVMVMKVLVFTSILERTRLYAMFQAWNRWRIDSLSVRISGTTVPNSGETRTARVMSYADQDLTSHHLTLPVRCVLKWKARVIIKRWHLKAKRNCEIQASLLEAINRRRTRDISAAFRLWNLSTAQANQASTSQELALQRMFFTLQQFSAQRLMKIDTLTIYFSRWENVLRLSQIQSLAEANSGKKKSINQEVKARGFEILGRLLTNKYTLRMARGLRTLQKAAQENVLDCEKILLNQEVKARGFEILGHLLTNKNTLRMARGLRTLQKAAQENVLEILRKAERITGLFTYFQKPVLRTAWKKWTSRDRRQKVLQRTLQPFLVASRLALNVLHNRRPSRMGGRQATRPYSSSFLMSFVHSDEEKYKRVVANAFYIWADASRELSRRAGALFKILVCLHKLNLKHGMQKWRRASWFIGREKENRTAILLETYNRDHLRLRSYVLRNLVNHKVFAEQQYSILWAWKHWLMHVSLKWRDEWKAAKLGLVIYHVAGAAHRLQLSTAFMKWKRKNNNMNRIRSGLQLNFSVALRVFLRQEHCAFSTWRMASSSAASRHTEDILIHEKGNRGAVMVYGLLVRFRLGTIRRLWTAWKCFNVKCFKLEVGAVLGSAGVRLVTSILTRSEIVRTRRLFKLWSARASYHAMYYQGIERGGRLLFSVLNRKLCFTHKQRRFGTWREGVKRLVDGEQRHRMLACSSIIQTWYRTVRRLQTFHLYCAWSHWRNLCATATQNQIVLEALCAQRMVALRNTSRIFIQQRLKHLGKAWDIWQNFTQHNAWLESSTLEGVYYVASVLQRTTVRSNRTHLAWAWCKWRVLLAVGGRHQLEEQSSVIMSKGKAVLSAFLIKKALSSLSRCSVERHFRHWVGQTRRFTLARPAIKALQRLLKVKIMNAAWRHWLRASDRNALNSSVKAIRLTSNLVIVHEKCTRAVSSLRSAFQLWKVSAVCGRTADLRFILATNMSNRLSERFCKYRMRHAFDTWVNTTERSTYSEMQSMSGAFFMAHTIQHILSRIRKRLLARAVQTLRNHCAVRKESSPAAILSRELQVTKHNSAGRPGEEGSSTTSELVNNEETAAHQEQQLHEHRPILPAAPLQRRNITVEGLHTEEVEFHKTMTAATSRVLLLKRQQKLRIVVIASLRRQSYDWHISPLSCCFRKWKDANLGWTPVH